MKLKSLVATAAALLLSLPALAAETLPVAENFPSKTVRLVVPYSAGGSADKIARLLAEELGKVWNQSVVVENIPGAGGSIATSQVVRSAADGHTLLVFGESAALNTILLKNPGYARQDLAGVVRAVVSPQILVVRPSLGVSNLQQYLELAKKQPGQIALGLPAAGGIAQIAHEVINQEADISVNFIPYPGGAPAAVDVIGGHIDGTMITLAAVTEYVRAGRLTPIAVTTPYRSAALPDVPTVAESGLAGYAVESWQGLIAPAATPKPVLNKINRDVQALLQQPEIRQKAADLGFGFAEFHDPADVDAVLQREYDVYSEIIRSAGITL